LSEDNQYWQPLSFYAHDGARLCGRLYRAAEKPPRSGPRPRPRPRPLVCLAGFIGHSGEFEQLAIHLSRHAAITRDVWCLDYRGRGMSPAARSLASYTLPAELRDIADFLSAFGIGRFDIIGNGRGALNVILLASLRPAAMGRVILNDMGPEIEAAGLARLVGSLATMPRPENFEQAGEIVRHMHQSQFPALEDDDWQAMARTMFREDEKGRIVPNFDPRLTTAQRFLDPSRALPGLWREFMALGNHPLLIIRGENSDILSLETLERMRTLMLKSKAVIVPGQGHVPLLRDPASLVTIENFLADPDRIDHTTKKPASTA